MPKMQCDFPGCSGAHEPNKETEKVFRDTDAGRNLESHHSLKVFFTAMGMKPNAKDEKLSKIQERLKEILTSTESIR